MELALFVVSGDCWHGKGAVMESMTLRTSTSNTAPRASHASVAASSRVACIDANTWSEVQITKDAKNKRKECGRRWT